MRCIHCLRVTTTNDDHVLPASWYPESTPTNVQHWTAPSCLECNSQFSKVEDDLRLRLIGSIDPKSDTALGLHAKALRSLGIGIVSKITEKEKQIREHRREKLKTEFIPLADVAELPGRIPGLGPANDDEAADAVMPVPLAALSIMAEKIARGCEYNYRKQQRFVEDPYGIRTFISEPGSMPDDFAVAAESISLGPACQITRVFAKEDPGVVLYWITIWNSLHLHVQIDYEAELKQIQFRKFQGISLPEGKSAMGIPDYLRDYQNRTPPN